MSSATSSHDAESREVIQMAAKVAFRDLVLATYGPKAADARTRFQEGVNEAIERIWPEQAGLPARLAPNTQKGTRSISPFRIFCRKTTPSENKSRPQLLLQILRSFDPCCRHSRLRQSRCRSHRSRFMAGDYLGGVHRARTEQSYGHVRIHRFGRRCFRRHFSDS